MSQKTTIILYRYKRESIFDWSNDDVLFAFISSSEKVNF